MKQMAMVTYGGNISSVCRSSLMIYCGKPQTPQRDVAIQKEPHCRHWKCEQKRDSVSRNAHKHVPPFLPLKHSPQRWGEKKSNHVLKYHLLFKSTALKACIYIIIYSA